MTKTSVEIKLLKKAQDGDEDALVKLFSRYERLIFKIAHRFKRYGISFDDAVSAGKIGLLKAVLGFDNTRGVVFSTYLYPKVVLEMQKVCNNDITTVNLPPATIRHIMARLINAEKRISQERNEEPSLDKQFAEAAGIPINRLLALGYFREYNSRDNDEIILQNIPDNCDMVENIHNKIDARQVFKMMTPRERIAVKLLFGFNSQKKSGRKIGKIIKRGAIDRRKHPERDDDITPQAVYHIVRRAFKRVRKELERRHGAL